MAASPHFHYRIRDHLVLPGVKMVEVWHGEQMIGTLNAHDIGGRQFLTFTSKHLAEARIDRRDPDAPGIIIGLEGI
jgi:hypothetical protein